MFPGCPDARERAGPRDKFPGGTQAQRARARRDIGTTFISMSVVEGLIKIQIHVYGTRVLSVWFAAAFFLFFWKMEMQCRNSK